MAENPYVNKVVFGNDTLVDLTEDSVTANNLLEGETAHSASGAPVTGTAKQGHVIVNASGTDMTQRTNMQFIGATVKDDSTNNRTVVTIPTYTEGDGIDITNNEISVDTAFTEASTRTNIASGETISTLFGKIKKFFSDLKAVAFSGAAADVTYGSGSVKDALDDRIPITDSSDGGVVFTVSRILVQKYSDSVIRVIFYDDDPTHTYKNAICYFQSTTFTPR